MIGRKNSGTIQITNKILKCGNEIYQINNLARVGKFKLKKKNDTFITLISIIAVATFAVGWNEPDFTPLGIGAIIVLAVIMLLRRSKYALRIETNSGSGELLWTSKEQVINDLIDLISTVMENQDQNVNYSVNMNDYSVREVVMGDKFSNIRDAVIATRNAMASGGGNG